MWLFWLPCSVGKGVGVDLGSQQGQRPPFFSFQTVTQWVQHGAWEDCGPFSRLGKGK